MDVFRRVTNDYLLQLLYHSYFSGVSLNVIASEITRSYNSKYLETFILPMNLCYILIILYMYM